MPATTSAELGRKIFRNISSMFALIDTVVLCLPAASRIDESELHLAATLWCSRMRDMPFDASDDSEIVGKYMRRVADSNERADREGPVDRQRIEGGIALYKDFHEYVRGGLEPAHVSPRNRHL